jgi:predicted DNA-binding transcriptional regulator AlpA
MSEDNRLKLNQMVENTGMLRREVAKYLGIHQRTLYRYMSGELEIPVMVMLAMELLAKRK